MASADKIKNILKAQADEQDEFSKQMALDAALNEDIGALDVDIEKISRKVSTVPHRVPKVKIEPPKIETVDERSGFISELSGLGAENIEIDLNQDSATTIQGTTPKLAPAATERFYKAKIKMLTQQVNDGAEVRKKLNESVNEVQHQLKSEREETKKLRKRIQILETENRRANNMKTSSNPNARQNIETLEQDVALLKKDLKTAERLAKQADSASKSKDLQLKRATETITKLKAQLQDAQSKNKGQDNGDQIKLEEAENRIKLLEKHRADLVDAFRKQMKLIDVLKKQKVHIEAARLLNFTEEEFMKTLDWVA